MDWTAETLKELYNYHVTLKYSYRLTAALLGNTTEAECRKTFNNTDWAELGLVDKDAEIAETTARTKLRDKEAKTYQTKSETAKYKAELMADTIEKSVEALPRVEKALWKPTKKHTTDRSEDVGLILSDLHVGHEHFLEDTGGITEYNTDIFLKRMANLKQAMEDIIDLHSNLYKLPVLRIFCLGDIVAGMNDVGAWSPVYINKSITDQVFLGADAIADLIYYFTTRFDEIYFYGQTGNHGRAASTGTQKEYDNWDYVTYKFVEARLKDNPRVKFNIPKAWWDIQTIRGYNFLMVHGQDIKGGPMAARKFMDFEAKMATIIKKPIDYTLVGHYHNVAEIGTNTGKIIFNGSFVGGDVYSIKNVYASAKPQQKIFGIGEKHGITWTYDLNLDAERP